MITDDCKFGKQGPHLTSDLISGTFLRLRSIIPDQGMPRWYYFRVESLEGSRQHLSTVRPLGISLHFIGSVDNWDWPEIRCLMEDWS